MRMIYPVSVIFKNGPKMEERDAKSHICFINEVSCYGQFSRLLTFNLHKLHFCIPC